LHEAFSEEQDRVERNVKSSITGEETKNSTTSTCSVGRKQGITTQPRSCDDSRSITREIVIGEEWRQKTNAWV